MWKIKNYTYKCHYNEFTAKVLVQKYIFCINYNKNRPFKLKIKKLDMLMFPGLI